MLHVSLQNASDPPCGRGLLCPGQANQPSVGGLMTLVEVLDMHWLCFHVVAGGNSLLWTVSQLPSKQKVI